MAGTATPNWAPREPRHDTPLLAGIAMMAPFPICHSEAAEASGLITTHTEPFYPVHANDIHQGPGSRLGRPAVGGGARPGGVNISQLLGLAASRLPRDRQEPAGGGVSPALPHPHRKESWTWQKL